MSRPHTPKAEADALSARAAAGDPCHRGGRPFDTDEFLRIGVLAKMYGVTKATVRRWFRLAEQGEDSPLPRREMLSPKVSGCWRSAHDEHRASRRER